MRRHTEDNLSEFEYQMLMHTDITYTGSRAAADGTYRGFATKSTWSEFYLRQVETPTLVQDNVIIWPWDLAAFVKDLPGGFIGVLKSAPRAVKDFWDRVSAKGASQEAARLLRGDLLRDFFRQLGTDERFIRLRPTEARICRIIAGVEPAANGPIVLPDGPFVDDEVEKLIAEIAYKVGVILAASAVALGLMVSITGASIAIAGALGPAAPVVLFIGFVLIHLVALGWAVAVLAAIVTLVVNGIMIFGGGSDAGEVTYPRLALAGA